MLPITEKFLKEYDSEHFRFDNVKYRSGAPITSRFGLEKGYEVVNGKLLFNTVRIHSGVDRAKGSTGVIFSPFDFDLIIYKDYGPDHVYGSLLRLFNFEYQFEFRIVHIEPNQLSVDLKAAIKSQTGIKRNTLIGNAGSYGKSSGIHTHTEILSMQETNVVFDDILKNHYTDTRKEYSAEEVVAFYHTTEKFKDSTNVPIIHHWTELIKSRYIVNDKINQYRYQFKDWYYGRKVRTRYSTQLLFNGL